MKKVLVVFLFSALFFSCEKDNDYLIPSREVPEWLKSDITRQEQIIKDSPQLMNAYGAWLRYQWGNEFYFEYHNDLSSSSPRATSYDRKTIIPVWDVNTDYYNEKCCKVYVWKAPNARDY
ncbi:MAG TPA: hypothetical protein VK155_14655 [Bacteroidales bacterium]|nr:hypothetical protein [Bacteroidales bacterium]